MLFSRPCAFYLILKFTLRGQKTFLVAEGSASKNPFSFSWFNLGSNKWKDNFPQLYNDIFDFYLIKQTSSLELITIRLKLY